MNQDQNYGVIFKNNSLYISFSKGFTYRIESYPTFQCWKRRPNGKWKQISYIDLDLNTRSIFVFRNEYERPFLKKSNYTALKIEFENEKDEFPKLSEEVSGIKARNWMKSNLQFAYKEIDKYFDQIPKQYVDIVGKFNTSYSLQFRMLRECYINDDLLLFAKEEPFLAYNYLLRQYFVNDDKLSKEMDFASFQNLDSKKFCELFEMSFRFFDLSRKLEHEILKDNIGLHFMLILKNTRTCAYLFDLKNINEATIEFLYYAREKNQFNFSITFLENLTSKRLSRLTSNFKNIIKSSTFTEIQKNADTLVEMLKQAYKLNPQIIFSKLYVLKSYLKRNKKNCCDLLEPLLEEAPPFKDTENIESIGRISSFNLENTETYQYQMKSPERAIIKLKKLDTGWIVVELVWIFADYSDGTRYLSKKIIKEWLGIHSIGKENYLQTHYNLTEDGCSHRESIAWYDYQYFSKRCSPLAFLPSLGVSKKMWKYSLFKFYLGQFHFFTEEEILRIVDFNYISFKILNKFSLNSLRSLHFASDRNHRIDTRFIFNYKPLQKFLRHVKVINEYNVKFLYTICFFQANESDICISFFEQVSDLSDKVLITQYFNIYHELKSYNRNWKINSIEHLEHFHKVLISEIRNTHDYEKLKDEPSFPISTFTSKNHFQQISSPAELYIESKEQSHCCYSYRNEIESGKMIFYSVTVFERCTLALQKSELGWNLYQIKSRFNQPASKETMDYVQDWMKANGILEN